ncbi:glycoside hydrolase family 25 protein [Bosea sp. SSUT16]|uniref:Glycoside hydrolase family 25 protein n=1 Tax=Bosea spartocytisi TaxID=2773451 RepID=A0A927E8T6_9HYPH|nr:GH25 family lysozyme [Bosea spartocytisi]MBD3846399.1 glycoside hydrolase family 25 protein [Bosea spartocytisi]MCT4471945.1 glycoside hydrolase family 25 protein [Bosea spartocytisi]
MPARKLTHGRIYLGAFAFLTALTCLAEPVFALYPKKGDSAPHHGVRDARRKVIQGIDVSRWQGEIDWEKVKGAGTRFAFIKATEGGDHLDPNFRRNWAEAKKHGVPRSAYHFVWWCRPAAEQVRWIKKHIPRDPDALPPVLDVEWQNGSQCARRVSREDALAKIEIMLKGLREHTGKKPIIYTDINFHEDVLEGAFNDHPYWLRSTAAPLAKRYARDRWEFWQFTTTGRVPGIAGDVDRNAFFGSEREFEAWRQGRFDIGLRKWHGGEPKVAARMPPPTPAGLRAPRAAGGATLKFAPPGRIPSRTADSRDVGTTGSVRRN